MQMNPSPVRATLRRLLIVAFGITAGTDLAAGQIHTVTIDVTTSQISYSDSQNPGLSAYRLGVEEGESVVWQVVTAKPTNGHYSAMVFFPRGTPFADASGRPIISRVWSDRTPKSPQASVVEQFGTYEYYVAVYDEDHAKTFVEDPKIIVGNGNYSAKINVAIENLKEANTELSRDPKLREQAERIEAIKKELQHILAEMGK